MKKRVERLQKNVDLLKEFNEHIEEYAEIELKEIQKQKEEHRF